MNECCVSCKNNKYIDGEWICTCEVSEGYGLETMPNDYCGEWEGKE